MCWGRATSLESTQINNVKLELEKGIRYLSGVLDWRSARSILECAAECAKDQPCFGFNFWSHECELLSATASGRTNNSPGWTHGHTVTGKYQTRHMENSLSLKAVSKTKSLVSSISFS